MLDLRTIVPLDREPILASLRRTSRLVIAQEAVTDFGVGAEIAALAAREGFWSLDAPVARVGAPLARAVRAEPGAGVARGACGHRPRRQGGGRVLTATRPHALGYDLPGATLAGRLRRAVVEHGDATAVIEGDVSVTFAELATAAGRVAAGLRERGVRPGDRVVTQLPNWWESVVVSWGVFLSGAVLVPAVPIYRTREMRFIIDQVRPRAVIAPAWFRSYPHAAELRTVIAGLGIGAAVVSVRGDAPGAESLDALLDQRHGLPDSVSRPEDIAVVLYTSGTTSQPKGVLHSHQTLLAEAGDVAAWCRLDGGDRVFMASPLSHITGLSDGIVLPADLGCAVVLQDRWDPRAAVELIERHGCSFTVSATPFLRGLADAYDGRGPSRLRVFVCGGADIPAELVRRASRVIGTRVVRTYGSTELPTSSMADPFGDLDAGAQGRASQWGATR